MKQIETKVGSDPGSGRLLALMFLSGFAGISYEILYGRLLGDLLGDQFAVSTSVLITFLLGIGWGARGAHRLWSKLWLVEAGIGLYALLFLASLPWVDGVLYSGGPLLSGGLGGSILVGVLLLLVPSFLIGCSLPLFAGYLEATSPGRAFARAYALYNLGAAGTALGIEFALIRWLGISGSLVVMAGINLMVALGLRFGIPTPEPGPEVAEGEDSAATSGVPRQILLALILFSFGSAVFQLTLVKLAEMVLGPFRETFALVLSLVLLGVAGGSWVVRLRGWSFSRVVGINLLGLLLLAFGLEPAIHLYSRSYASWSGSYLGSVGLKWCFLGMLMALPCLGYGAAIPALMREEGRVARSSGFLLFVSSVANAGGFLAMALVFHPHFDYGPLILLTMLFSGLALLVFLELRSHHLVLAVLGAGLVWGLHRTTWDEDLLYLSYTKFRSPEVLAAARKEFDFSDRYKGFQDVFSIVWRQGRPYFFINGYVSIALDSPSEKIVGALSSLFAPRRDRGLVLGLGSGATASAVGLFFDHTDVVEINPVVRDNLFRMKRWNYDLEANSRVQIHVDDGVHFVKSPREPYSLILNTVTSPLYFSSSKLYTRDFLEQVKARLTPDGIYVTWMDTRVGDVGGDIILRTLSESFSHCALLFVKGSYFLLVASDHPLKAAPGELLGENPSLRADLLEKYGVSPGDLAYCLVTPEAFSLMGDPEVAANTLDHPVLEFRMASLRAREFPALVARLESQLDVAAVARTLDPSQEFDPYRLLFMAEDLLGECALTRAWRNKVREADPDFPRHLEAKRLLFLDSFPPGKGAAIALHRYAFQLSQAGLLDRAAAILARVLEQDPKKAGAHLQLGEILEQKALLSAALGEYQAEQKISPEDLEAVFREGRVLFKLQRFVLARERLLLVRKRGSVPFNEYFLGMSEAILGHPEEAKAALRRALAERPEDPEVRRALDHLGRKARP